MRNIYLDYAAATPLDERVFAAMEPYLKENFYNPSAAYQPAREVRRAIDDARHRMAIVLGARQSEIIMTAGATESINLAIRGYLAQAKGQVVSTKIEHPAVIETAKLFDATFVSPTGKGLVRVDDIRAAITDETTLVSVGYINNELGTIQPIKDIAQLCQAVRADRVSRGVMTPLAFHTDASQAAGVLDLSVSRLGVDMMTLNGGKCYGPKQTGLLYVNSMIHLQPVIFGGGQERGLRSGTENVAGIIGFAKALELAEKHRKQEGTRLEKLRDEFQRTLESSLDGIIINGHPKKRAPHHLHISLPGLDGERGLFALDAEGIYVATGSACAANKGARSHVLEAVGMSDGCADGSLRFSLGRMTSEEQMREAADVVVAILKRERNL